MGKQINFYMTDADEQDFVEFIHSQAASLILPYSTLSPRIVPLTHLPQRGVPFWGVVRLWNESISSEPERRYVAAQRHYVIDTIRSEVIELSRSYIDEGRLVRGRIWAEMTIAPGADSGENYHKSELFQKWFAKLAKWIKRRSIRDQAGDYLLPGAAKYVQGGGQAVQAVFASNVKFVQHDLD